MNAPSRLHNNPPDPLDEAIGTDPEALELADGLLTGDPVENEAQMKAADGVAKRLKALKKAVADAEESEAKPIYDQWKAAKARFKPTLDDLDKQIKGLAAMVSDFKRKLAAEKAEAERKAREEAEAKAAAAAKARAEADVSDIDAQRAAEEAVRESEEAAKAARIAKAQNDVKGLRTVTRYEITDHRAALHDIAANDRDAVTAFIEGYVAKNYRSRAIAGVRVWEDREAF